MVTAYGYKQIWLYYWDTLDYYIVSTVYCTYKNYTNLAIWDSLVSPWLGDQDLRAHELDAEAANSKVGRWDGPGDHQAICEIFIGYV